MDIRPHQPQRGRRYFDVASPGRMPASSTSRPIAPQRMAPVDPMFARPQPTQAVAPAQPTQTPIKPVFASASDSRPIAPVQQDIAPVQYNTPVVAKDPLRQVTNTQQLERPTPLPPRPTPTPIPRVLVSAEDQALLTTLPVELPDTETADSNHLLEAHNKINRRHRLKPLQWVLMIVLVLFTIALVGVVGYIITNIMTSEEVETVKIQDV